MNLKTGAISIVLLSLFISASFAQEMNTASPPSDLIIYVDFAGFLDLNNPEKTYQEIYLSFPNFQLAYMEKGMKFIAAYRFSIDITDSTDVQIEHKEWEQVNQIDSLDQAEGLTSLEIAAFLLTPGLYSVKIEVKDLNSGATGFADKLMPVSKFQPDGMQLSEIEFARSIVKSGSRNKFVKNNIEVLPYPSRVFGIESPFLMFYAEIYNLDHGDSLLKEYSIIDNNSKTIESSTKTIQVQSSTSVWVEKINTLNIISGKYLLRLKVTNKSTHTAAEREAGLWIDNPYKVVSLNQYNDDNLKEFRSQIAYLVDQNELKFFDELNIPAKIQYINDFWNKKKPEFRAEHLKRYFIAQERFGSPTIPGWKSDRGRIYIMFGPPDQADREPASVNTRAFEVWFYESLENQGRVEFVFCDFGILGNYQLIHSNLKSGEQVEIYNPEWEDEVMISP